MFEDLMPFWVVPLLLTCFFYIIVSIISIRLQGPKVPLMTSPFVATLSRSSSTREEECGAAKCQVPANYPSSLP